MRPSVMTRTAAAVLAVSIGGLAGCTSSAPTSDKRPSASTAASAGTTLQQNPLPTSLPPNQPDVRGNVTQTKCAAVTGGWGAAGTVKNPTGKQVTYRILVYFTTLQATTLDYAATEVEVPAGKTVDWKAEKKFSAQAKMLCPMPSISTT